MILRYACTTDFKWNKTKLGKVAYFATFHGVIPCFVNFFPFVIQTAIQLKAEYEERLRRHNYTYNSYAASTYDAAWSIALMLNKSIPLFRERNQTLETMNYWDKEAAKIMRDILFRTDFWGMSVCTLLLVLRDVITTALLGRNFTYIFLASFDSSTNINATFCF